jgi:DNA polymerase
MRLVRDFETRCDVSVVDVGPRRYAADPSLELLCVGFCVHDGSSWGRPLVAVGVGGTDGRAAIERRVREAGFHTCTLDDYRDWYFASDVCVAHNSSFERAIEARLFPEFAALKKRQSCTAARSRRLSLPGSLEDVCKVLRTPHQKSMDGHRIMLQVSQPRPTWVSKRQGAKYFEDAERLAATAIYCAQDILAECDLDSYLPELPPEEYARWLHTELCNERGVQLDVELINAMSAAVKRDVESALEMARKASGVQDLELTNPARIRDWCATRGVYLPDMRANTLATVLAAQENGAKPLPPDVLTVLEARRTVGGKSSLGKLPTMRARVMDDSRARDLTIYHGAHTGRTTGDGINVLNLPRPYRGFDQDFVIASILKGDDQAIRVKQKVSPSTAVSAALRGVIIPSNGNRLVVGDYSSVEPCCLFTLAKQWDVVEILRRKGDLYCEFASQVLQREITENDPIERTLFKQVVLGCGYGLSEDGFVIKCNSEGVTASEEMIRFGHKSYRTRFTQVPKLWRGFETAMKAAIRNPHVAYAYNGVNFMFDGWWMVMTLPGGQSMYYPNTRLVDGRYGDDIVYEGWMRIDGRPAGWGDVRTFGARIVENAVQKICREIMEEDQQEIEAIPGWEVRLTVYDEIVAEAPRSDNYAKERMTHIMSQSSTSMPEMPVSAKVFLTDRYVKK